MQLDTSPLTEISHMISYDSHMISWEIIWFSCDHMISHIHVLFLIWSDDFLIWESYDLIWVCDLSYDFNFSYDFSEANTNFSYEVKHFSYDLIWLCDLSYDFSFSYDFSEANTNVSYYEVKIFSYDLIRKYDLSYDFNPMSNTHTQKLTQDV